MGNRMGNMGSKKGTMGNKTGTSMGSKSNVFNKKGPEMPKISTVAAVRGNSKGNKRSTAGNGALKNGNFEVATNKEVYSRTEFSKLLKDYLTQTKSRHKPVEVALGVTKRTLTNYLNGATGHGEEKEKKLAILIKDLVEKRPELRAIFYHENRALTPTELTELKEEKFRKYVYDFFPFVPTKNQLIVLNAIDSGLYANDSRITQMSQLLKRLNIKP